jgi:hypothetical protein
MNMISKVSSGKASLFTTYWLICFPIGLAINLTDKTTAPGQDLFLILLIPFLWSLYGVWKCAFNVRCQVWGYITRGIMIVNVLIFVLGFFAGFANELGKTRASMSTVSGNRPTGTAVVQDI